MIQAIVFDFDGVLADSEPLHMRAYQEVLAPLGVRIGRDEYYARYLGFNDEDAFRAVAADQGLALTDGRLDAMVAEKGRAYQRLLGSADVVYPGAAACVERLGAEYPLGIASGALRHEIETILRAAGLARHFTFIVASGDTPNSKPAPDPYARAARLHGVPPSACLAIEDSRWGIESAQAAGLTCIGITTSYSRADLRAADLVIDSLDRLTPDLIRSL
jgi:beta-phosphoglucomutase